MIIDGLSGEPNRRFPGGTAPGAEVRRPWVPLASHRAELWLRQQIEVGEHRLLVGLHISVM